MNDDDYIPSWNGTRGTPQDRLAIGCMWFIGAIPVVLILIMLIRLTHTGTPASLSGVG
jgi:hypothetical protein